MTATGLSLADRIEWRIDPGKQLDLHAIVDGDTVTLCGRPSPSADRKVRAGVHVERGRRRTPVCSDCIAIAQELHSQLEALLGGAHA